VVSVFWDDLARDLEDPEFRSQYEFHSFVMEWRAKRWPQEWRSGQALSNLLARIRPDLARELDGSMRDPFHRDERIKAALAWIEEHW
jgi:hypothetical protein